MKYSEWTPELGDFISEQDYEKNRKAAQRRKVVNKIIFYLMLTAAGVGILFSILYVVSRI
jgi:hypothetical protein